MVEAKTKQPEDKERSGSPRIGPVPVEIEGPVHVEPGNPGSPVKEQFQLRWAAPPARSFLGENQIHIWAALLDPPADELEQLFTTLLPRHVEVQVFRALLESNAAFYAAQMTAMDAATRNSGDMIESLTLYMNKVRQAAITREIIEVVSGAGAL